MVVLSLRGYISVQGGGLNSSRQWGGGKEDLDKSAFLGGQREGRDFQEWRGRTSWRGHRSKTKDEV